MNDTIYFSEPFPTIGKWDKFLLFFAPQKQYIDLMENTIIAYKILFGKIYITDIKKPTE